MTIRLVILTNTQLLCYKARPIPDAMNYCVKTMNIAFVLEN